MRVGLWIMLLVAGTATADTAARETGRIPFAVEVQRSAFAAPADLLVVPRFAPRVHSLLRELAELEPARQNSERKSAEQPRQPASTRPCRRAKASTPRADPCPLRPPISGRSMLA